MESSFTRRDFVRAVGIGRAQRGGLVEGLLLATVATAGVYYVNIMAALVTGLVESLSFTARQAGLVAAANVYGAAVGAFISSFLPGRLAWRPAVNALLLCLLAVDGISILVTQYEPLLAMRFLQGLLGGTLVGLAFSFIARTPRPDRNFGLMLVLSAASGSAGTAILPHFVPIFGATILFVVLIVANATGLVAVQFLQAPEPLPQGELRTPSPRHAVRFGTHAPLVLALVSVFLFQAGNMSLGAYILELGRAHGLPLDSASLALAVSQWIGLLGAMIVVRVDVRWGRFCPLVVGLAVTLGATFAYHWSAHAVVFSAACGLTAMTWNFVLPYLLGLCAKFDLTGRAAALAGFASKMGLASGPAFAALMWEGSHTARLINASVAVLTLAGAAALIPARIADLRQPDRAVSPPSAS